VDRIGGGKGSVSSRVHEEGLRHPEAQKECRAVNWCMLLHTWRSPGETLSTGARDSIFVCSIITRSQMEPIGVSRLPRLEKVCSCFAVRCSKGERRSLLTA